MSANDGMFGSIFSVLKDLDGHDTDPNAGQELLISLDRVFQTGTSSAPAASW